MASYYINSSTGNDSTGTGTSGNPWQTITKALSSSTTGDTINLQSAVATYSWSGNPTFTSRNLVGVSPSTCVIDAGGSALIIYGNTVNGIFNFTNLTFQNAVISAGQGLYLNLQSGVTTVFTNCIYTNISIPGNALLWDYGGNGSIATIGCSFYGLTTANNASIFALMSTSTIISTNTTFYNSAITANSLYLITASGTPSVIFKNNIFYTLNAIGWYQTGSGLVYTGSANNNIVGYTSVPTMTGTITSDPLFVNATGNDFNLRPTSLCMAGGVVI